MTIVSVTDALGKKVFLRKPPQRIVSLVPSDTYSLVRLGARERLVGGSDYCVEPADELAGLARVGGTKACDVRRVLELEPDLVLANREENGRRDVERLEEAGVPVYTSFPRSVADGVSHVARLARLLGLDASRPDAPVALREKAKATVRALYEALSRAEGEVRLAAPLRVFVPIWMNPLMTANGDTFLSSVLATLGALNVFGSRERRYPLEADLGRAPALAPERTEGRDTRYPRVTLAEVAEHAPDVVLLPDEPHFFTEADEAQLRGAVPTARIVRCDGKDLTWYGARAVEGLGRLRALLGASGAVAKTSD